MAVKIITQKEFDSEVITSDKVVLVDFFATWCMPCKMLSGVLDSVSQEVEGYASVVKLDIEENMDLAKKFGVMSVPTMVVMKGGKEADRMVGFRNAGQIKETLNKHK